MAINRHIQHIKSQVVENGAPKLPTSDQIQLGEIAINYAKGYETIAVKNSSGDIVTFTSDNYWVKKEETVAASLNDLDDRIIDLSGQTETVATALNDLDDRINELSAETSTNIEELEETLTSAVDDLDSRKAEKVALADLAEDVRVITETVTEFDNQIEDLSGQSETIAVALNDLDDNKIGKTINATWSELKALRDGGNLVEGQWYRITDYVTTTTQTNTQSANHAFDVIVRADSNSELNENAYAALHEGDSYFANSNLAAWELKYCLDNDTTKFAWADSTNGKGVIYWMKDEWNNECPYDFKNIIYKGEVSFIWVLGGPELEYKRDSSKDYTTSGINFYGFTNSSGPSPLYTKTLEITTSTPVYFGGSVLDYGYMKSVSNFSSFTFARQDKDASLNPKNVTDNLVYNNCIKPYYDQNYNLKLVLNRIYFKSNSDSLLSYNNIFGASCYNNTFGDSCYNNIFGASCYNNTFGGGCEANTFGNSCYNNTFGDYCYNNTFGNSCYNNTFGDYCYNNTFGGGCEANTFRDNCYINTFGNYCNANTFGDYCYNNTFGGGCEANTFRDNCYINTFGNYCNANTFGDYCYNNTFENSCNGNTFGKNFSCNIIIENGNSYITLTSNQSTSSSAKLQNITIAQGVNNTTTQKTISHNTVNDTFKTTYQSANSQIINV